MLSTHYNHHVHTPYDDSSNRVPSWLNFMRFESTPAQPRFAQIIPSCQFVVLNNHWLLERLHHECFARLIMFLGIVFICEPVLALREYSRMATRHATFETVAGIPRTIPSKRPNIICWNTSQAYNRVSRWAENSTSLPLRPCPMNSIPEYSPLLYKK